MTQSNNKFEQLLELLINEENDKAQALFHEIVVEKSRDIYEGLVETTDAEIDETTDAKEEEVKETEAKEETTDESTETTDEAESIEEVGGDATDDLLKDVSSEEHGDAITGEPAADAEAGEMPQDGESDAEHEEHQEIKDKVVDLEDALEELKAEFEKMMSGEKGEEHADAEKSEEAVAPEAQATFANAAEVATPVAAEAKKADKKDMKKETVKEYAIKKKADTADHSDKSAKSPIANKNDMGGTTANIAKGEEDNKKVTAPKAKDMGVAFENEPAKDKSSAFKKEVKADHKDGSDKSAKSPIASAKK